MLSYTDAQVRKEWIRSLDEQIDDSRKGLEYLQMLRNDIINYDREHKDD